VRRKPKEDTFLWLWLLYKKNRSNSSGLLARGHFVDVCLAGLLVRSHEKLELEACQIGLNT
jgi:hypothetical protein